MSAYSDYWRKNRSRQKAVELALGLRSLRKVADHIGEDVKPVYWKGMADATDDTILLDAELLPDRFPISPENFDLLVGKVVLEGLSSIEWTDQVRETLQKSFDDLPDAALSFLNEFLDSAEEIYIDALAGPSVWSLYLAEFWKQSLNELERDPLRPPSSKSLLQIWKKKALLDQKPRHLHLNYDDVLKILNSHIRSLQELAVIATSQERRDRRSDLYKKIWSEVWEVVSEWEMFRSRTELVPKPDPQVDVADDKHNQDTGTLDPNMLDEISWILEEGEIDLSQEILEAIQNPNAKSLETFLKKGSVLANYQPDTAQVKRLQRIFREHVTQVRRARNRVQKRGLLEGKLDPRRLYRVPIDGKTFKSKQVPGFDDLWQICIVADASASMSGKGGNMRPWRIAERTFATVIQAGRQFKNRIDIYAYFGTSNKCTITRLFHGNQLYTIKPSGQTPSGQAIMAVATLLDRKYKKNMIIHITDGAPNSGLPLTDAVDYCESKGIQIFTIGCGCTPFTQQFLKESFPPGCVYLMKSIENLSEALETLFKQWILRKDI